MWERDKQTLSLGQHKLPRPTATVLLLLALAYLSTTSTTDYATYKCKLQQAAAQLSLG